MNDFTEYFKKLSSDLNLDREDVISKIQANLDARYPGQIRAISLNNNQLRVVTPNASVASELRLRQVEILKQLHLVIPEDQAIEKLIIRIGSLG